MKQIGLVGGMSPESTKEYYSALVDLAQDAFGPESDNPVIIIYSINLSEMQGHMKAGRFDRATEMLSHALKMLHISGAEVLALTANTPHMFFDELQGKAKAPLVSIVEATFERARSIGVKRSLLMGTRHTMASDMYPKAFARGGIGIVVPDEKERERIDGAIRKELTHGDFLPQTKADLIAIGDRHIKEDGVDSVILGCTEIPLLLKEGDLPVPLLDTTRIHAEAIFRAAWTKDDEKRRPK